MRKWQQIHQLSQNVCGRPGQLSIRQRLPRCMPPFIRSQRLTVQISSEMLRTERIGVSPSALMSASLSTSSATCASQRGSDSGYYDLGLRDDSPLATWLHGLPRLQEGDLEDAENWYNRAGRHFRSRGNLDEELWLFKAALSARDYLE